MRELFYKMYMKTTGSHATQYYIVCTVSLLHTLSAVRILVYCLVVFLVYLYTAHSFQLAICNLCCHSKKYNLTPPTAWYHYHTEL